MSEKNISVMHEKNMKDVTSAQKVRKVLAQILLYSFLLFETTLAKPP